MLFAFDKYGTIIHQETSSPVFFPVLVSTWISTQEIGVYFQ